MLNKWMPALLSAASIGGAAVVYSVDSDYKIYIIVSQEDLNTGGIYKEDWDILRKRNSAAFGLDKSTNTAGTVWKASNKGKIYRDESYYVFSDWSWLNGIQIDGSEKTKFSGGENLKSYVDGIGLKVEDIKDDWKYNTNAWERTRNIQVKRVLMKNGHQFQNGKGTCLISTNNQTSKNDSGLYLLIGFLKTAGKGMTKMVEEEFLYGQESFCKNYQNNTYKIGNEQIAISFDVTNGKITGNEYPVLSVINDSQKWIKPIYWKTGGVEEVSPVVLAIAIKGKQKTDLNKEGWEILNERQAKQEIRKKIKDGEIVERHWKNNQTVGFQFKKKVGLKGEATEEWIAKAKVTFK